MQVIDHRQKQIFFRLEVVVHRADADAGFRCDGVDIRAGESVFREHTDGGVQDALPLFIADFGECRFVGCLLVAHSGLNGNLGYCGY